MSSTVRILTINPGSDGDGRKWPKHTYTRNDEYYKERIATSFWIKDLPGGPLPNVTYRLNQLPNGYGGFEKLRPDGERVDYFVYGHPNGRFDSLTKFYPHFKHLMDHGNSIGCTCDNCASDGKKRGGGNGGVTSTSRNESERSNSPPQRSRFFVSQNQDARESATVPSDLISPFTAKKRGRPRKYGHTEQLPIEPPKSKLADIEGIPDVYEALITKVKEGNHEEVIDVPIKEHISPDWRTADVSSKELFKQWQKMPRYMPRIGEVVLFVRTLKASEEIAWDARAQTFRRIDRSKRVWLEQPRWEAGVVTQMPQEDLADSDLMTDQLRKQGVSYSGFRVEPLSEPGNENKPYKKQHKHVPLHLIRPFAYWKECVQGLRAEDWHPSIRHALMIASSFSVVGRFRFKGVWPNATIFARGVYVGPELIVPGDVVRLQPRQHEQDLNRITDVMQVTAIRLRVVNLDLEEDDISFGDGSSYQTCLHISGRVFTLDPSRSFSDMKFPIDPKSGGLPTPTGTQSYGRWYHYLDPSTAKVVEIPYTRVIGKCFEDTAMKAWFGRQPDMPSPTPFQPTDQKQVIAEAGLYLEISRGLQGALDARQYSQQNDKRIEGATWLWADTRIEQLDLHEVNGRYVGVKAGRMLQDIRKWRAAIKALDGKSSTAQGEFRDMKKAGDAETAERELNAFSASAYGMVSSSMRNLTESSGPTDAEDFEDGDIMDIDEDPHTDQIRSGEDLESGKTSGGEEVDHFSERAQPTLKNEVIALSSSEDEEDLATSRLAEELAKKIRPNDPRVR